MQGRHGAMAVLGLVVALQGSGVGAGEIPASVVADIKREMALPPRGPEGRPLPLAASWSCGHADWHKGIRTGFSPDYQITLLEAGHHILPWIAARLATNRQLAASYYAQCLTNLAAHGLPFAIVTANMEDPLKDDEYRSLPLEQRPNFTLRDGTVKDAASPFGPSEPWQEVGAMWPTTEQFIAMQAIYPDPPAVIYVSNNEHPKMRWHEADDSIRYDALYGDTYDEMSGKDKHGLRDSIGQKWTVLYQAMHNSFRTGLTATAWQTNILFVGYGAFGMIDYARWYQWHNYSLHTDTIISYWPRIWDGGSPPYYVHNWSPLTDFKVRSPQIEAFNWVFMLEEALNYNTNFFFELSVWDGHQEGYPDDDKRLYYGRRGWTFDPARYVGMVKFGMWLMRPRVVREFRNYRDTVEHDGEYLKAICEAVDELYDDETLEEFWRRGELVPNTAWEHLYTYNELANYEAENRWFLLDCDANPDRPWDLYDELKVFAIALKLGSVGARRWLVYAHAPVEDEIAVQLTIPDGPDIMINVPREGTTVHVMENTNNAPLAWPDTAATDRDTAVMLNVVGNDRDVDGDALRLISVWGAAHGTAARLDGTNVTYRPGYGVSGEDVFSYTVRDAAGAMATGRVKVVIQGAPTNGLEPEADAYVRSGVNATNTYGTLGTLVARYSDPPGNDRQEFYLRFALPTLATGTVESATLKLCAGPRNSGTISNAMDFVSEDGWDELTLSYSNRPAAGAAVSVWPVPSTVTDVSCDVTDLVLQELAGDGLLSLCVRPTADSGSMAWASYGSREQSELSCRPRLVITLTNSLPRPGFRQWVESGSDLGVLFDSLTGWVYDVEYTTNLLHGGDWQALTNDWPGTGQALEFPAPLGLPQRFYRLKARQDG